MKKIAKQHCCKNFAFVIGYNLRANVFAYMHVCLIYYNLYILNLCMYLLCI